MKYLSGPANARGSAKRISRPEFLQRLASWRHVLVACILRDMKTRFGGSYHNYIIAVLWPTVHMGVLLTAYVFAHSVAPMGSEPAVFAATGILPYILCLYPARFMTASVSQNKSLLQFPHVKPIDIIIGRAVLETFNACVATLIFFFGLYVAGVDVWPVDVQAAAAAIGATVSLGLSIGMLNVVLFSLFGVGAVYGAVFLTTGLYLTSGAFFPLEYVPPAFLQIDLFNPLLHCVEWLRFAFYDTEPLYLSRSYVICVAAGFLALGLLGERLLRGKII